MKNTHDDNTRFEAKAYQKQFLGTKIQTRVVRLSESELALADPALDVRDRKVIDSTGREIGHIHDLFVDANAEEVRFLEVASGGFFGLGETRFLIPVEAVTGLSENALFLNQTRSRVVEAPAYNPQLASESYYADIYNYYGYSPYWGLSYACITYPH